MADSLLSTGVLPSAFTPINAPPPKPPAVQLDSDSGLGSDASPSPSPIRLEKVTKRPRIPHALILDNAERIIGPPNTPSRKPSSPASSKYKIWQPSPSPSRPTTPASYKSHNLSADVPARLVPKRTYCTCYAPSSDEPMVQCESADCSIGWFHVKCLSNLEKGTLKRWNRFTCRSCRTNQELAKKPFPALASLAMTEEFKAEVMGALAIPGGMQPVRDPHGLASNPPVESVWAMAQTQYQEAREKDMEDGDEEDAEEDGYEYYEDGKEEGDEGNNGDENDNHDGKRRSGDIEYDEENEPEFGWIGGLPIDLETIAKAYPRP